MALPGEELQDPVARLSQCGEGLERLEGCGQPPAVSLVVVAHAAATPRDGSRGAAQRNGICWLIGRGCARYRQVRPAVERLAAVRGARRLHPAERRVDARAASPRGRAARRSRRCPARRSFRRSPRGRAGRRPCGLHAEALDHAASAASTAPRSRLDAGQGPARRRERARVPSASSTRSRAAGSSAGPSKRKPASGQNSPSVWIFSCAIATRRAAPSRPVSSSSRRVSSSGGSARM